MPHFRCLFGPPFSSFHLDFFFFLFIYLFSFWRYWQKTVWDFENQLFLWNVISSGKWWSVARKCYWRKQWDWKLPWLGNGSNLHGWAASTNLLECEVYFFNFITHTWLASKFLLFFRQNKAFSSVFTFLVIT